jgi:hypothetical protein
MKITMKKIDVKILNILVNVEEKDVGGIMIPKDVFHIMVN